MNRTLLVVLALLAACHPKTTSGGIDVYESVWTRTDRDLRYRAAMELRCRPELVELTLVQRQGRFPTVVHASGCNTQALYSRRLRRHRGNYTDANSTWVVESSGPGDYGPRDAANEVAPMKEYAPASKACTPVPDPGAGCKYSHYRGFMQFDEDRVYRVCDGAEPADVTDSLPIDSCKLVLPGER